MQTLKIALFRDGRPGHEKQSLGIVAALRRYVEVDLTEFELQRKSVVAQITAHLRYLLRLEGNPYRDVSADLVIGTGSQTHIPVLVTARSCRCRAVTCMTPPGHLRQRFDLCCVPMHDRVTERDNIFRTIGPPNIAPASTSHDTSRGLILIGGVDQASHEWNSERLLEDIQLLLTEDREWTISTSPRTPLETEKLVQDSVTLRTGISFMPFSVTPPGWVEEQYRRNESVWITGDSISMVYEALSAGCSVGIIPVQWKKADNKFKRSIEYLRKRNLVRSLDDFTHGATPLMNQEPLNEADRCAREILRRWWPTHIR